MISMVRRTQDYGDLGPLSWSIADINRFDTYQIEVSASMFNQL